MNLLIKLLTFLLISSILLNFSCTTSEHIYNRSQLLMGTIVDITIAAGNETLADKAINAAFAEIRRLEEIMSTYIPSSDISRLNKASGLKPVKVSKDLIYIVKRALEFSRLTDGAFNIALGPVIELWKINETNEIPSREELDHIKPLIDYNNIIINDEDQTIFLKKRGMSLNLGGIGKGFASDKAFEVLTNHNIRNGIIAIAGDLRVFGKKPGGKLWNVGIRHPRIKDGLLAKIKLSDMAISTSGDYERFVILNGVKYHHILSSYTLEPARGSQGVSIIAKDSTTADALATAIFVLGPAKGFEVIKRLPDVEGIIVAADGSIKISSGLEGHVEMEIDTSL